MSTTNIRTLQEMIIKRAAKRLDTDLKAIHDFVRGNRILQATDSGMPYLTFNMRKESGQEKQHTDTKPPYWVFQYEYTTLNYIKSSVYMDDLRRYWLDIYIEEETKSFLQTVDQLSHSAENLLDSEEG